MIHLDTAKKIGSGTIRDCYLSPLDDNKVIKVIMSHKRSDQKANLQEWKHYNYLIKKHGEIACIPKCYGFVETSLGTGLMSECIRDYNGSISKTLQQFVALETYNKDALFKSLDSFCKILIERNIQLFDINLGNIVINILENKNYKPVSIDLKGRYNNCEFIPLSTYVPFLSKKKLQRRSLQLIERLEASIKEKCNIMSTQ